MGDIVVSKGRGDSVMVKNICIDANISTLGAFLSEIEPFY